MRYSDKRIEVLNMLDWMHMIKNKWWRNKETWERIIDIVWKKIKYYEYYPWIWKFREKYGDEFVFRKDDPVMSKTLWWNRRSKHFVFKNKRWEILVIIRNIIALRNLLTETPQDWLIDRLLKFKKLYCPNAVMCEETDYDWTVYEIDLTD